MDDGSVRVRRVGFRDGTDEELTALHAVESVVERERRPDRVPQPLHSYISFARNLPAQFDDHTWLGETGGGVPIATAACWSNSAGDGRLMECDVFVLGEHRRQGIGWRMLAEICSVTEEEGRELLTWSTFDAVPAGESFSIRLGANKARVNRTSEARLDQCDWSMIDRWIGDCAGRAAGYSLEWIQGPFPADKRADAARFHHIMNTAPQEDLEGAHMMITEENVADLDRALVEAGRDRWAILVRDPGGACVGGTEVTFEPWEPETGLQQNTGIDPDHRGRGLAKWAKAAMVERIRRERPEVQRVRTGNAFSNAAMLAINDAMGFKVISVRTEWQAPIAQISRSLRP